MDDSSEYVGEHMPVYGLRLDWREILHLCEQARSQTRMDAEAFVLVRLREMAAAKTA